MATIKRFEEIISWQAARELNKMLGALIDTGRFKNNIRLINQIEGSAGSIMDNIAEGFERSGNKEFRQFLYISKGSCGELRSQLYRALDRKIIMEDEYEMFSTKTKNISSLLQKLINYITNSDAKGSKFKEQ